MSHRQEINSILKLVADWPLAERAALAGQLLAAPVAAGQPPIPRDTYVKARGIGRGNGPPPSDDDVKRWIDEHRMQKHG